MFILTTEPLKWSNVGAATCAQQLCQRVNGAEPRNTNGAEKVLGFHLLSMFDRQLFWPIMWQHFPAGLFRSSTRSLAPPGSDVVTALGRDRTCSLTALLRHSLFLTGSGRILTRRTGRDVTNRVATRRACFFLTGQFLKLLFSSGGKLDFLSA